MIDGGSMWGCLSKGLHGIINMVQSLAADHPIIDEHWLLELERAAQRVIDLCKVLREKNKRD